MKRSKYNPKQPHRTYPEWKSWEDWLGEAAQPKVEAVPSLRAGPRVWSLARAEDHAGVVPLPSRRKATRYPLTSRPCRRWSMPMYGLDLERETRLAPFEEAHAFVQGMKLPHAQAWQIYALCEVVGWRANGQYRAAVVPRTPRSA